MFCLHSINKKKSGLILKESDSTFRINQGRTFLHQTSQCCPPPQFFFSFFHPVPPPPKKKKYTHNERRKRRQLLLSGLFIFLGGKKDEGDGFTFNYTCGAIAYILIQRRFDTVKKKLFNYSEMNNDDHYEVGGW